MEWKALKKIVQVTAIAVVVASFIWQVSLGLCPVA